MKHSECLTKKFLDDESSDEHGNGAGAGHVGLGSSSAGHQRTGGSGSTVNSASRSPREPQGSAPCESIITITPAEGEVTSGGEEDVPDSSNHLQTGKRYKNGYTSDSDRHSCSDVAYAIEVTEEQRPSEHPPTALSLAKKGKKFFFNWFFLKKKTKAQAEAAAPSTSVGIYKTKSFAELKLRSSSASKATPNSMDVNMNL